MIDKGVQLLTAGLQLVTAGLQLLTVDKEVAWRSSSGDCGAAAVATVSSWTKVFVEPVRKRLHILSAVCGVRASNGVASHPLARLESRSGQVIPQFARSRALLEHRPSSALADSTPMTITESTRRQLFDKTDSLQVIRIDQKRHAPRTATATTPTGAEHYRVGTWTIEEHELFLEALGLYPSGPWKRVAQHVGSRTPRQVMTHAQKYRQRLQRREASKCKAVEVLNKPSEKVETDRVLAVVVSPMPMPIPMPSAGTTGEMQVEAGLWVLPPTTADRNARPAVFSDDPPPYGHFQFFEMDYSFLTHLAADPMFDDVDMTLPNADIEPLQF